MGYTLIFRRKDGIQEVLHSEHKGYLRNKRIELKEKLGILPDMSPIIPDHKEWNFQMGIKFPATLPNNKKVKS